MKEGKAQEVGRTEEPELEGGLRILQCRRTARRRTEKEKALFVSEEDLHKIRRRPTLPQRFRCSTIGSGGLDCRVRDGIGYDPSDIATESCRSFFRFPRKRGGREWQLLKRTLVQ